MAESVVVSTVVQDAKMYLRVAVGSEVVLLPYSVAEDMARTLNRLVPYKHNQVLHKNHVFIGKPEPLKVCDDCGDEITTLALEVNGVWKHATGEACYSKGGRT